MKILNVNDLKPKTDAEQRVVAVMRQVARAQADPQCVDTLHEWVTVADSYLLPQQRKTLERMMGYPIPEAPSKDQISSLIDVLVQSKRNLDDARATFDVARCDKNVSTEQFTEMTTRLDAVRTDFNRAADNVKFFWKSLSGAQRERVRQTYHG